MERDYAHPRFTNPKAGVNAGKDDWEAMAKEAAAALARRIQSYPQLIDAGKLEASNAAADIAAWKAIAEDWHWIVTGEGEAPHIATLRGHRTARIAALDTAIDRFFAAMDKTGGADRLTSAARQQITALAAMRWWAGREGQSRASIHVRELARIGHDYRKSNGHPTLWQSQQATTMRKAA